MQSSGKFVIVVPLHCFGSTGAISRFGERFRDGQSSLVSFLFAVFLLTVPPVPCGIGDGVCTCYFSKIHHHTLAR